MTDVAAILHLSRLQQGPPVLRCTDSRPPEAHPHPHPHTRAKFVNAEKETLDVAVSTVESLQFHK